MGTEPTLPLDEVLRRCHRDELLPLAAVLKVNPAGMGRDRLAHVLDLALRAAGASGMENLVLRQGKGPAWPKVLSGLAKRRFVNVEPDEAATELALLQQWRANGGADASQVTALARVLGPSTTEIVVARPRRPWSPLEIAVAVVVGFLRIVAPIVGPLTAIWLLLWISRPRDEILLPAILVVAQLRRRVARRFTIGVVGPPSSGKDAALGAVFGIHTGNVHPVAGSTREVGVYHVPRAEGLQVVNTPGVGDVVQQLTDETRAVLDQVDVFLFLVNAQGGVRTREKTEFQVCRARLRPILVVVNKIDTLKAEDRPRFLDDVRAKLGLHPSNVVAAAFDPLPALSPTPLGVDEVRAWLRARLAELGRDPALLPDPVPRRTAQSGSQAPSQ